MLRLRAFLAFTVVPFAIAAFAACGSEVATSSGGSSSHGGSGGSSSSSGSSSSGTAGAGGAPACPTLPPTWDDPCSYDGQSCFYPDGCCGSSYECTNGIWTEQPTGCDPPVGCPATLPAPGDHCEPCFDPGPCAFTCADGATQVTTSCVGGVWEISGSCPVPPPVDCGGTTCADGEICVQSEGGAGIGFACAPDPCAPAGLSCDCAGSLCGGTPIVCDVVSPQTLLCSCPNCA